MDSKLLRKRLKETGALLTGHFRLSSGKHSDKYVQCAKLLQHPEYCNAVAKEIRNLFKVDNPDVVIGPAIGGVTLAYEVARVFKVRGIWAERKNKKMVLSRGFQIEKGEKVLVVEDVITTGGSVKEVLELMKRNGARVIGIACIVNRAPRNPFKNYKFKWLTKMKLNVYSKKDCPKCKLGLPTEVPGSRGKA